MNGDIVRILLKLLFLLNFIVQLMPLELSIAFLDPFVPPQQLSLNHCGISSSISPTTATTSEITLPSRERLRFVKSLLLTSRSSRSRLLTTTASKSKSADIVVDLLNQDVLLVLKVVTFPFFHIIFIIIAMIVVISVLILLL